MKLLAAGVFAAAVLSAGGAAQTFAGVISDESCAASHAGMRMGPTDAACAKACVDAHGVSYVLQIESRSYLLSDQKSAEKFAGQKVSVVGTLDAATKTIQVESMAAAK